MYRIIIQRNCSYLCFKGTSSNIPHPPQPPAVVSAAAVVFPAVSVAADAPLAVPLLQSELVPTPLPSSHAPILIASCSFITRKTRAEMKNDLISWVE